jgi:hypothetical protein
MLSDGLLVARQKAEPEFLGAPEELVHRGLARDAHPDEGRLQGKGDHRSDCEPEPLAFDIHRENGDAGGKSAEELSELLAWRAQRRRSTSSTSTSDSSSRRSGSTSAS